MTDTMDYKAPSKNGLDVIGDPKKFIQTWNAKMNDARMARLNFEKQWYLNYAFYYGKQWVVIDTTKSLAGPRIVEPNLPRSRVRFVDNKILPYTRKELAKINKEQIRGFVASSTSDDEDAAAARAAERVNDYLIYQTKLQKKFAQADWWMCITGTGFIKDYYNPELLDEAAIEPGTPGKIVVEAISPFHILVPNTDEPDIDNQEWVAHVAIKSPHEVEAVYGIKLEGTKISSSVEAKLLAAQGSTAQHTKKGVEVKEVWVAPCSEYPDGLVVVFAEEKVLSVLPAWPYRHGEYPFTKREHIETGRFYTESSITNLVPIQTTYNRAVSQIIENVNRMSKLQLVAPKGAISNPRMLTNEPGLLIEYNLGFGEPKPLPLQGLPAYVENNIQRLSDAMDFQVSQGDIARGEAPGRLDSATGIAYLQEEQDGILTNTLRDKELGWQRVCKHMLSHAIQYWDSQRMIRAVGKDANFEAFALSSADLRDNTDFRVVAGSATPTSRAAKQAQLMELRKMGDIPPDKFLDFLDMPDLAKLVDEMQEDFKEAQRENLMMSKDIPANVYSFQEHLIHLKTHDSFRKSEEYQSVSPRAQMLFQIHSFIHILAAVSATGYDMTPLGIQPGMNILDPTVAQGLLSINPNLELILRDYLIQIQAQSQAAGPVPK
jgi:hypothetical protein